ncbi:MAG: hypothetical protein K2R98_27460 [Gemmataceae bacterium]|nr:hypothetical protein [Gemmataceae bacterium]
MHFLVHMKIRLRQPMEPSADESSTRLSRDGPLLGYYITMKVNAENVADAAALAQTMALAPPDRQGKDRNFDGVVEEANIEQMDPEAGPEHVRKLLAPMGQRGVYYKTGLMFFHSEDDGRDMKKWWQFWK